MTAPTILVVDDEQHLLDTVHFILSTHGYRVLTARSGEEALGRLESLRAAGRRPDLILTDLQMPGQTGLELIARLRAGEERAPILAMTGFNDPQTARRLEAAGCTCCLEKPFEEEQLLERIRELLK